MLWNISSRTDYLKIFFRRIHLYLFYNTYCITRIVKCSDETSYEVNGNEYLKLIWEIQWNLRISIFKPYWSNVHLLEPKRFHEKLFFQDQFWLHSCILLHAPWWSTINLTLLTNIFRSVGKSKVYSYILLCLHGREPIVYLNNGLIFRIDYCLVFTIWSFG